MPEISNPLAEALRDRCLLERVLGRGGMATVYLARDLKHERQVALKSPIWSMPRGSIPSPPR